MLSGGATPLERLLGGRPIHHVVWGLERTRSLLAALGNPERRFVAYHVAGTNGKGTAAACAAGVLRAAGHRTGLYTSPHLVDVRERFQVDGARVAEALLQDAAGRVSEPADRLGATYFEAATALAFLCFARAGVERAVVEVGLGGRLDATNVLRPRACAITSVSSDHREVLGRTEPEIAREKAGILKRDVPAVLGPVAPRVRRVFLRAARRVGAPLAWLGREARVDRVRVGPDGTAFRYRSRVAPEGWELRLPLPGRHHASNAATALLGLEMAGELPAPATVRSALGALQWPGRFQRLRGEGEWILDIAHNPAGAAALSAALEAVRPPRPLVFVVGVLRDKAWRAILGALPADAPRLLTVAPSMPAERRWNPEAAALEDPAAVAEPELGRALRRARELAGVGTVVVMGSTYTVGDALGLLEPWRPGTDPYDPAPADGRRRPDEDTTRPGEA